MSTGGVADHFNLLFEQSLRRKAEAENRTLRAERDAAIAESLEKDELIAHQAMMIEKLRKQIFGRRSEKARYLYDQAELPLFFPACANDDALAEQDPDSAEQDPDQDQKQPEAPKRSRKPRKNVRKPWPKDAEIEEIFYPAPKMCSCKCTQLHYRGTVTTETLELIPRRYKRIIRKFEKVSCRACDKILQAPAPHHPTPRGMLGPTLLASILVDKYHYHIPLNRQSKRFAREDVSLSVQTLADQVGHCVWTLMPLFALIEAYVFSAERLHVDDTVIRIRAKDRCRTGRVWTYVRDDRPFGGKDPPAVIYYATRDRRGEHPLRHFGDYGGIAQMDCFSGFVGLWDPERKENVITPAFCWAHARRKLFELADAQKRAFEISQKKGNPKPISPIALEAVRRIDVLFKIERDIIGMTAEERRTVRQKESKPLVEDLHAWMVEQCKMLSRSSEVLKAMNYMLVRWEGFARYLDDGRICMTNNAAERSVRGVAVGRKNWMFAGSDEGATYCSFSHPIVN